MLIWSVMPVLTAHLCQSFLSITNFIECQQRDPPWPLPPMLDIITACIYWPFIMCHTLFWQFNVNYFIYSLQELHDVKAVNPFYRWGNSGKGQIKTWSSLLQRKQLSVLEDYVSSKQQWYFKSAKVCKTWFLLAYKNCTSLWSMIW